MLSVLNVPIVEEHQEVIVQKDLESVAPVSLKKYPWGHIEINTDLICS